MIECAVVYYFKTPEGRIVRFSRNVSFPAVPFVGSRLSLKDDTLHVECVEFVEGSIPNLIVEDADVTDSAEMDEHIEDMIDRGWVVLSDIVKNR